MEKQNNSSKLTIVELFFFLDNWQVRKISTVLLIHANEFHALLTGFNFRE